MAMQIGVAGVKSDINVTPLVDVVLVLLIIFMVVTPMLQRGVYVSLPKAKHVASSREGDPMIVGIKPDGTVWVEKEQVTLDQLKDRVATLVRNEPGRRLLLKGDASLQYGKVRVVLDKIAKAGAGGISLAAEELKTASAAGAP